ncbi:lytic transglycosylase domain-containing protein, partial [Mycobacteroides abscessus]|uniref:lytic transglycosylase domain-containing protein n=1 Tax=Mycobacteroides abscessus TaxID=36809 RepID=UPI003CF99B87
MGGAKYLSELLSSFNGDAKLAVAAYNAGSGSVRKYGGVPPYAETQNYVKKVLGYAGEDISAVGWSSGNESGTVNNSDSDASVNDIT